MARRTGRKVQAWTQRSPGPTVARAIARAKDDPAAMELKLNKRTKLVNWLLEQFGEGKVKVKQ